MILEIRYRLPRLWEAVLSGRCAWWRAKIVAEATMILCEEGAEHVDRHVNGFTHSVSNAQLDRVVQAALARWEPEKAEAHRKATAEKRGCDHPPARAGRRPVRDRRHQRRASTPRTRWTSRPRCPTGPTS